MAHVSGLPLLNEWQNFDIIIGTVVANLTGWMCVATSLVAGIERPLQTLDRNKAWAGC